MPRIYPVKRDGDRLIKTSSGLELDGLSDNTIPSSAIKGQVGGGGDFVSGDGGQYTIYQQSTAPSSPSEGDLWFDTS